MVQQQTGWAETSVKQLIILSTRAVGMAVGGACVTAMLEAFHIDFVTRATDHGRAVDFTTVKQTILTRAGKCILLH
jgi:hypothetical protein